LAIKLQWTTNSKNNLQDNKFKVEQVGKYNTRIGDENSTITISKVENYENDGIVIHIYVSELEVRSPQRPAGISNEIGHLLLSKEAILKV
jgi:hypothetical protein